jgi:mannan endo-1,6-alpha-mannosidase
MMEVACEKINTCNIDQKSFKALFARDLAATAKVAPFTYDTIMKKLSTSAEAAAEKCVDSSADESDDKGLTVCPLQWIKTDDSEISLSKEVGSQMSALQIIQVNLLDQASAPTTTSDPEYDSGNGDSDASGTGTGSPTSSGTGAATSTGAASIISASQALLASPILSFIFSYLL